MVEALVIDCQGDGMTAILHRPLGEIAPVGLIIVVGGPQYRVGPHRLYRELARTAAAHGHAALRFDYRGRGDSDGVWHGIERGKPDIEAAIRALRQAVPQVGAIVLWGLCEGASAILVHGPELPDVAGAILANPWIEDQGLVAQTRLRHHYPGRIGSGAFWRRLLTGKVDAKAAIAGFIATLRQKNRDHGSDPLSARMAAGAKALPAALWLLSELDDTALRFSAALAGLPEWRAIRDGLDIAWLDGADHSFSSAQAGKAVLRLTLLYLKRVSP